MEILENISSLEERITQKIRREGTLSFRDFMEMALYDPEAGYYNSAQHRLGCKGDYYTSPYLGAIFGAMIGRQLEDMWDILKERSFIIAEYGAGTGVLCRDILNYLRQNSAFYEDLTYYIIEKSPAMIEKEKTLLAGFTGKVKWVSSITEIQNLRGCVLSNEVVDNFATHLVVMEDELMEVFVGHCGTFSEQLRPAGRELSDYLDRYNIQLPKGYRTEINLEAERWIGEIGRTLKKGFVLTIDYGYTATELYSLQRDSGTLLCYHKHTINPDPFRNVGEQDITTHINFSALAQAGLKEGLQHCGFTTQYNFLLGLGFSNYLRQLEQANQNSEYKDDSLFTLLVGMGQKLKILIQKKDIKECALRGVQFQLPFDRMIQPEAAR